MGKYLRLFEAHVEYEEARQNLILPNVSYCEDNKDVHFNPLPYQGFCKLTLNNGSTVELEGSGELSGSMVDSYRETLVSAEIGELCTSIGSNAFFECTGLTSVTIPDSVTSIGDSAFGECHSLTSVTIPNSITSIGYGVFVGCSFTSIDIPNSVTSIGDYAFSYCTSLTSVTIPNSVTSIGEAAFEGCSFTSIDIPNSVTSIDTNYAFKGCTNLTIYCEQGSYAETFANENNIVAI